jgi:hypothetical protein
MGLPRLAVITLTSIALVGCASVAPRIALAIPEDGPLTSETQRQQDDAMRLIQARFDRARRVWHRLIAANAELCAARTRTAGFSMHSLNSYPAELRDAAARNFHIDADAHVDFVAPGSPAEAAGLRASDRIVRLNGQSIRKGALNARPDQPDRAVDQAAELLDQALGATDPLTLEVLRDGAFQTIAFTPAAACDHPLGIVEDDLPNAVADGKGVVISTGMLRFVQNEAELAVVLGHELAHNALEHRERGEHAARADRWRGGPLGVLVGAIKGPRGGFGAEARGAREIDLSFEREADYQGLYFAARAGYDTAGFEQFWRRFAAEYPTSTYLRESHPTSAERYLHIAAVNNEIAAKRARGLELRPNSDGATLAIGSRQ